ncbi:hypothetical protein ASE01_00360 [Nocardioides sp. Root190]|uniref:hypothetical protein n=1 Tax=Nocardioides sp. Root190 TaxID=1736488 RepID=UPI0006F2B59E|nr:hypothetical protein [Nocardioides sp. Root190]KRB79999.1 hypothetical protein ASE01_00360 [Nocardioides sp. Root190]
MRESGLVRPCGGPPARTWSIIVGLITATLLASCAVACSVGDDPVVTDPRRAGEPSNAELLLQFDEVAVPGDAVPSAVNDGRVEASVSVVTWAGGRLAWDRGWEGGGVRTPAFGAAQRTPTAALVVVPTVERELEPGTRDFVIGVDFAADAPESGRPGDNGDNLLQRGRFDAMAQFKLQLDHGVPGCRLSGDKGAVVVVAPDPVQPGHWYRLTCQRTAGRVGLQLTDLESGVTVGEWWKRADPGDIRFTGVPVSVGAKVSDAGRIDPAGSDQFHGVIDRVVVDIS